MTLSASERVEQRPLGLICVFSPGTIRREVTSGPSRAGLRTSVSWTPDLGLGGSSPQASWGSVGVGRVLCVTPSVVSATGGVELTSLALTAQVTCSVSSLAGMSEWNPGPSFADGVSIALMWHSTAP